jgi:hypothetical protein
LAAAAAADQVRARSGRKWCTRRFHRQVHYLLQVEPFQLLGILSRGVCWHNPVWVGLTNISIESCYVSTGPNHKRKGLPFCVSLLLSASCKMVFAVSLVDGDSRLSAEISFPEFKVLLYVREKGWKII